MSRADELAALNAKVDALTGLVQALAPKVGPNPRIADLIESFLRFERPRTCPTHVKQVGRALERITDSAKVEMAMDLSVELLERFAAEREGAGVGPRTVNYDLASARACFRWALRRKLIASNPIEALQLLPVNEATLRKKRRALSEEEIRAFLAAAAADDQRRQNRMGARKTIANRTKGKAWRGRGKMPGHPVVPQLPLWRFLLERGARVGETLRVTWGDFDQAAKTLTLQAATTKTKRTRVVPLSETLTTAVAELRPIHRQVLGREVEPTDYVFVRPRGTRWRLDHGSAMPKAGKEVGPRGRRGSGSLRCVFRRILAEAGIPERDEQGQSVDLHSLRGTCATRLFRSGLSLDVIMRVQGWTTADVPRKHYLRLDVVDTAAALARVPELGSGGK